MGTSVSRRCVATTSVPGSGAKRPALSVVTRNAVREYAHMPWPTAS